MLAVLLAAISLATGTARQSPARPADPLAGVDAEVARAEQALQNDERQIAESRFRSALYNGWMLTGALELADGRVQQARDAFARAAAAVVNADEALQSLAVVELRLGDAADALKILTRLVAANPRQPVLRRVLAQALIANRQPEEAVQALEEAHRAMPDDLETTFALASGYLQVKKTDAAEALFKQITAARPIPQTYVLIGRAYRDAGDYARARGALEKALAMDPRVRHAHYYLGTLGVRAEGVVRVEDAIAEFRQELALSPKDPFINEWLGMALVEAHREAEALPHLQLAAGAAGARALTFEYLGRCDLVLGRQADAVAAFRRAVELGSAEPGTKHVGSLHYQLARALRQAGDTTAADAEFAIAEQSSASRAEQARDELARYMRDSEDTAGPGGAPTVALDTGAVSEVSADRRRELATRVATTLARVSLNLGIMHAQAGRFARAAERFEEAAALAPSFPQVQYSLGVAYFNTQQYAKAAPALAHAVAQDPANVQARRMLAIASLNIDDFAKTAELLGDDPERDTDPSLQFAYGMALVRSGKAAEAEAIFSQVLAANRDSPELNVVIGQAHAEQGDYDAAIASLQRALQLKPDVAEANSALGVIYLKQGKLAEAAQVLKAELASHPADARARYNLATVLDLDGQSDAAVDEVRTVLKARPDYADARYLLGKVLLARGAATDAVEQLEIAARLAPEDANVQYQLGLAYQKLGRGELAQQHFDAFQRLKDKRRGGSR
jgi:tetratricopeptide (TPR) repeat protein